MADEYFWIKNEQCKTEFNLIQHNVDPSTGGDCVAVTVKNDMNLYFKEVDCRTPHYYVCMVRNDGKQFLLLSFRLVLASWSSGNTFVSGLRGLSMKSLAGKLDTVLPTARHRCDIFSKAALLPRRNDMRRWASQTLYKLRRNTESVIKDLSCFVPFIKFLGREAMKKRSGF